MAVWEMSCLNIIFLVMPFLRIFSWEIEFWRFLMIGFIIILKSWNTKLLWEGDPFTVFSNSGEKKTHTLGKILF